MSRKRKTPDDGGGGEFEGAEDSLQQGMSSFLYTYTGMLWWAHLTEMLPLSTFAAFQDKGSLG